MKPQAHRLPPVVVGFGLSGQALARYFFKNNQPFYWWSSRGQDQPPWPAIQVASGNWPTAWTMKTGYVYLSPGISPQILRQCLPAAKQPLLRTEWDLPGLDYHRGCAVTGTNGKSSVVLGLSYLLQQAGHPTAIVGNWGVSPLDISAQVIPVIEWSSYQLALTQQIPRTKISILTNCDSDHLAWHGSLAAYQQAKFRIFEHCDFGICPAHFKAKWSGDNFFGFHLQQPSQSIAGIAKHHQHDWLYLPGNQPLIACQDLGLNSSYLLENLLCIATAAWLYGIDLETIRTNLCRLPSLPFRQQKITDKLGRLWVNDSKATNHHAVISAMHNMPKETYPHQIWLIGGQHKRPLQFESLWPLAAHADLVIFWGCDALEWAQNWPNHHFCISTDLSQAVLQALDLANTNSTFIFSPGGASFDAYSGFMARGFDFFKILQNFDLL